MRRRPRADLRTNHLETSTIDRRTALNTLATIPFAISGIPIAQLAARGESLHEKQSDAAWLVTSV